MSKVFLGGTCNGSDWRERLIPMLRIDYFSPVVPDWTPECQAEEIRQRQSCDFCLYTITPFMTGVYSIAEVVDDSNKRPDKTVFCMLAHDQDHGLTAEQLRLASRRARMMVRDLDFTEPQLRSLDAVAQMVVRNGGHAFKRLEDCAMWLNEAR